MAFQENNRRSANHHYGGGRSGGRGRSSPVDAHSYRRKGPAEGSNPSAGDSYGSNNQTPRGRGKYSHHSRPGSGSRNFYGKPATNFVYQPKRPSFDVTLNARETGDGSMKQPEDVHPVSDVDNVNVDVGRIQITETPQREAKDCTILNADKEGNIIGPAKDSPLVTEADKKDENFEEKGSEQSAVLWFDICPPKEGTPVTLKPSLLVKNRQKRNEVKREMGGLNGSVLKPGMVLLKNYLSLSEQVKIIKTCRNLGLGPGGFYQPGYREGGRLHLKMMCLGKNWDPDTGDYGEFRPRDHEKPPPIPAEFHQMVKKAIEDSHALIKKDSQVSKAEAVLPWMSPNICLVNFYSATGKLGLHQDRDESQESLDKRLPVVSFSIGDTAEFLYSEQRDVDSAEKVKLESGDALVFGGKSRLIFHGVSSIFSNTSPKTLQDETNLRPGRLNLTFRQY